MKLLSGTFYRLKETARAGEILAPANNPEGRFHYDGQHAIYLSETPEGCGVAMAYYAKPNEPEQTLFSLRLSNAQILDLCDTAQCARFKINPSAAQDRWQMERNDGRVASTWAISDAARAIGADGMLYPSRNRPELTHLVLFKWNQNPGPTLQQRP